MTGPDRQRTEAGFRERTPLATAREQLASVVSEAGPPTETVPVPAADGRILQESITAERDVPHYDRAAMDGYAVTAASTYSASDTSPAVLTAADEAGRETAVRVHTGSPIPDGADAVVKIEDVETQGEEVAVQRPVAEGENVAPRGEDVVAGQQLYEPGHRLRPSDLGLCRAIGTETLTVAQSPTVAVCPTGEELVTDDPDPGEIIETNGLTVARLLERWGAQASRERVTTDDPAAIRETLETHRDADAIVTTGGSSVGERDLVPEVLADLGTVHVHGVALKPGHPVALGEIEGTPVCVLPGYPVACIVNAVQFCRPLVAWLQGGHPRPHPTVQARLERKVPSEPGTRTFARVALTETDDGWVAEPTRASGAGVLSSVALADGWVVVPEETEGYPADHEVTVELWE